MYREGTVANTIDPIIMSVLTAASQAAQILTFRNAFIDRIYWNFQPIVGVPFGTLNVPIPTVQEGNVVNIGSGPIQPTSYALTVKPIVLDTNYSDSFMIKDWDQVRTPIMLRDFIFPARIEEMFRAINRKVVALFNATNFPNYTLFTGNGTVANQTTRADISTAWLNLAKVGVPVDDFGNVTLMIQPETYAAMISDPNFLQQYVVGDAQAQQVQQRAVLRAQYGAEIYWDQMMTPFNTGHAAAALFHRFAVAGVTAYPPNGGSNVQQTTINVKNIPVRVQVAYSMIDQGWIVHLNALFGLAVTRPEMASLFQTAS